ncbi:MAG: glycosyltransferase family 2 protein [Anaerolineae bacterium]|nr:glycosyltransferase family 2 protein [Anaerolineae bacterium]
MGIKPVALSIVIVSWNTCELLSRCLASIETHPPASPYEVIVVDNASADGSARMVREGFPWVRLIENDENVGFARANNQGIRGSAGRFTLLLNPDTEVRDGALEILVNFLENHPRTGAAGARLLNPDGTLQPSCHPAPTLAREFWRLFHLDAIYPHARYPMHRWGQDRPRQVEVLQGACLLLRREALEQVGLLDEDYFMYTEEVDLCHRLRRGGWHLYWVPQAQVVHHGGQSTRQAAGEMFLHLYRSKVLFFRKHHGPPAARLYKLLLLAASLARLACNPLAWLLRPRYRSEHLALARHYRQLINTLPGM